MITLEEVKQIAKGYEVVPISGEILADIRTPMEVLRIQTRLHRFCICSKQETGSSKGCRNTCE